MSTNGHSEAAKIRGRLSHPVIDADGHWIEYAPLMREEFRRIGGDAAEEAPAIARQRIPPPLRLSPAERRRRPGGPEAVLSSPRGEGPGPAAAMLPRRP